MERDNSPRSILKALYVDNDLPDIDPECEEFKPPQCIFCHAIFENPYILQAHLLSQQHSSAHKSTTESAMDRFYNCLQCRAFVETFQIINHACILPVIRDLEATHSNILFNGSPLACLFCDGEPQMTKFHLIAHIIIRHGNFTPSNECPICGAIFKSTSKEVLERHAFQVHVPEYFILERKAKYINRVPSSIFKREMSHLYVCNHPNQSYAVHRKTKQKNCEATFNNLSNYTSHIVSQHSNEKIPNRCIEKYSSFCYSCPKGFETEQALLDHINLIHLGNTNRRLSFLRNQATCRQDFNTNAEFLCFFCWCYFENKAHLQTHIICSHTSYSWRICGLCGREYCKENEKISPALLWLAIAIHEKQHAKTALENFATYLLIEKQNELTLSSKLISEIEVTQDTSKFFFKDRRKSSLQRDVRLKLIQMADMKCNSDYSER